MKKEIQVPEMGESITSGILAAWLKSDGDQVQEGEEIFELETDKATLAVPSPAGGALAVSIVPKSSQKHGAMHLAAAVVCVQKLPPLKAGAVCL